MDDKQRHGLIWKVPNKEVLGSLYLNVDEFSKSVVVIMYFVIQL
jgi:hypothetical protein